MKNITLLFLLFLFNLNLNAQRIIGINKIVLPELTLHDVVFQNQLDSILFIKYTYRFSSEERIQKYVYFIKIEEVQFGCYNIAIFHAKLSAVEDDINTGAYILKNQLMIIRESSKTPIFKLTSKKKIINYEKELMKRNNKVDSYYYDEMIHPEEFCSWRLSYFRGRIEILGLENVNIPYEKPKMLDKIEPIRYH